MNDQLDVITESWLKVRSGLYSMADLCRIVTFMRYCRRLGER